ncbi:uncharacterized protein [Antedon mediterranea]|uniref:uncharacterized protein n=1 Tax=Antedon mediterranea TaxID=105859 RepID=UPI003AF442BF
MKNEVMVLKLVAFVFLVLSTTYAENEDIGVNEKSSADFSAVDSLMLDFLKKNHYSGATMGISKGNRLLYTQGYGKTTSGEIKMQPTTLLPISSLSKTITAVAILKLHSDNQMNLTDRVFGPSGILENIVPLDSVIRDKQVLGITVQHLLEHTSGWGQMTPYLYDPMLNPVYLARGHNVTNIALEMGINGILTHNDIIKFMLTKNLQSTPGMRFHYSNFGYCILGRIVEEISGMPYEEYIKEEILSPLGMIHTRLGPHQDGYIGDSLQPTLNFDEGALDIFTDATYTQDLFELWDSTLGWFSTVYDISRFVNGLTEGSLVDHSVLSLLRTRPISLISAKKERWYGYGVFTDRSQAWWQVSDQNGDEILLHHIRCRNKITVKDGQTFCKDNEDLSVVIIMSSNNRKDIKQLSESLIASVETWPASDELSVNDLGIKTNDDVFVASMIPENDIKAVTNAFLRLKYNPSWMDAYVVNGKTLFTVVFKLDKKHNYRVAYLKTKQSLNLLVEKNLKDGYTISFVVSCNSQQDSGRTRHSVVFRNRKESKKEDNSLTWWNQSWKKYITGTLNYYKSYNYAPVIQSVIVHKGMKHVSYRFEKKKSKNWKSYVDLPRESLEQVIKENAQHNRRLRYLDSYFENGELLFSGVFTSDSNTWMVQVDLTETELRENLTQMSKRNYEPEMIIGYEANEQPMFVVVWKN